MNCKLDFPAQLSLENQNPIFEISPYYRDQMTVARVADIAETIEVSTNRKVHYVYGRELRKVLEKPHRYGQCEEDDKNPFGTNARSFFGNFTGFTSMFTLFSEESSIIRRYIIDYMHKNLKEFHEGWAAITKKHVDMWVSEGKVRIGQALARLFMEMTAKTMLGYDGDYDSILTTLNELLYIQPGPTVHQYHEQQKSGFVTKAVNNVKSTMDYYWLHGMKTYAQYKKSRVIDVAAEEIINADSQFVQFLKEKGMTEQSIKDNFVTLLLAGQVTTSSLLTLVIDEYIKNPDLQVLDRNEILEKEDLPLDKLDGPQKMVLETLRLYPPGGSSRYMRHDTVLHYGNNKHYFRKGDEVTWFSLPASRKEESDDFEKFNRDREGLEIMHNLPFGSGFHLCPGKKVVMPEALIIISTLLKNAEIYRIDPMPELFSGVALAPEKDYFVGFRSLN